MTSSKQTIRFPHRRSMGTLYVAPANQPEEWELLSQVRGLIVTPENQPIKWEWLEEARGSVEIPAGNKVKLKITGQMARGLAPLEDLGPDDLHTLDLSHSDASDDGLAHIAALTGLRVLELTSTHVTDNAAIHLVKLKQLQGLGLSYCRLTNRCLPWLGQLTALRELWLSAADIDDSGLVFLKPLNQLVQLGLSGTRITDEGLKELEHLKQLLRVYLFSTAVSQGGTQELRKVLGKCRIKWNPASAHGADHVEQAGGSDMDGVSILSQFLPPEMSAIDSPAGATADGCNAAGDCAMSETDFWQIMDKLDWNKLGDDNAVIDPVVSALCELSVKDIYAFADLLSEKLHSLDGEVFAREIGQDAYGDPTKTFSKDWFLFVRCCVVANGKNFYEEVLSNPAHMPKDLEFESVLRIPQKAYERKTGKRYSHNPKYNVQTFSNHKRWEHEASGARS